MRTKRSGVLCRNQRQPGEDRLRKARNQVFLARDDVTDLPETKIIFVLFFVLLCG